jgi:AraC-like DNA-binding protein
MVRGAFLCTGVLTVARFAECLHAGQGAAGARGHLHTHPFDEFLLILSGQGEITIAATVYPVSGGDMLYYPVDTVHQECSAGGAPYSYFTTKGRLPGAIGRVTHDTDGRLRVLARWLVEEVKSSRQDGQRAMDALANTMLIELVRLSQAKPASPIDEIRRYLGDNLAQPHAVGALADKAKMSRYHFIRSYRRRTGHTPMEDLRRMRVDAACDLLLTTTLPLKEIAAQVGFYDEFHFSKVFRAYHRVPPGSFRGRVYR